MLRITLFGLCAELMLGIVTGLGSVMSFCLLWLLMRFVVRMNRDPGETEYDESLGDSNCDIL